jgi:hypothetical protein
MPMANDVGDVRRSTVVYTFGPGAVVDFRADGATVSGVVAGLEEWDRNFKPEGLTNPQRVHEPRLEAKLGVRGFRLPPVIDKNWKDDVGRGDPRRLVSVRFPDWLQCPSCDRIAPSRKWADEPGKAYRYCVSCTARSPGQGKVFTIPVRFVMACSAGHLMDFPWYNWIPHKEGCRNQNGFLVLRSIRPGLAGLIVSCPKCHEEHSMDGVFSEGTWQAHTCRGSRPWLGSHEASCDKQVRVMQRGASNLYFPAVSSALSIPPWSDALQEALGIYWHSIVAAEPEHRAGFITVLAGGELNTVLENLGMTPDQLAAEIERRVNALDGLRSEAIREEEYRQFTLGSSSGSIKDSEFETRAVDIPRHLAPFFNRIIKVVRLREVMAIYGFTRVNPPGDEEVSEVSPISRSNLDWLPALEVRGEGIFLEFSSEALSEWENRSEVLERARQVNEAWKEDWKKRYGDEVPPREITGRQLLLHSFSHVLMRQLTLECGYSSASLKERLYVSSGSSGMAGVLVYTATPDADGTLGGLQRQADTVRIGATIPAAVQAAEWCSSDPLCIEGLLASPDAFSNSSCHACILAPETACEEYNRFLDRALLVGTPASADTGYFSSLLADS